MKLAGSSRERDEGYIYLMGDLFHTHSCFFFSYMKSHISCACPGVLPKYFSSEWSFAQFHLPEDTQYIAAFASQNTVIIVGMNGR
jgi:hypothetical protein